MKTRLLTWGGALALSGALSLALGFANPAAAQTKWNLPGAYSADNYHSENLVFFAKEVEKETGGKLQVTVHAGAYSIEAANPRHEHEWVVWRDVRLPPGKILIPGVVTHHVTTIEHPELVAQRIVRFAEVVGPENVIAGSDCGFAQSEGIQRQHPSVMWAKLEALAEGARLASRQLFG